MIRAFVAAAALALSACGGGGGGAQAPATAQAGPGTSPGSTATAPSPASGSTAPPAPSPAPAAGPALAAGAPDVANTTLAGNQSVRSVDALADGGYAVAWLSQDASGNAALVVQRYDAQGAKGGTEIHVGYPVAAQEDPAIAVLRDGSIVVASVSSAANGSTVDWTVFARRFAANGVAVGSDVAVASFTETPVGATQHLSFAQPVLQSLADGGVAIGWASVTQDDRGSVNGLHVQRFDARLAPVATPVDFAPNGIDANVALKIVPLPAGDFIAGTTHRFQGIPYVQFHVGPRDIGPLFDANAGLPEFNTTLVPLADGRLALWSTGSAGGYMQMLDAAGRVMAPATSIPVVPETAAALPDGGWVTIVRQMQGLPNLAQRHDASGAAVGNAIEVSEGMARPLPTTSMGNAFALGWNFTGALGDSDVRTQRIVAN